MGDLRPPLIAQKWRIRQRQVIYKMCIRQYRVGEVGIVKGSNGEPRHKKRPNRLDWAFILPAVAIGDSSGRVPPDRSSP